MTALISACMADVIVATAYAPDVSQAMSFDVSVTQTFVRSILSILETRPVWFLAVGGYAVGVIMSVWLAYRTRIVWFAASALLPLTAIVVLWMHVAIQAEPDVVFKGAFCLGMTAVLCGLNGARISLRPIAYGVPASLMTSFVLGAGYSFASLTFC